MKPLTTNSNIPQNEPVRVLQVVTYMGRGGLETMIMNYYRHMDRSRIQFDFLEHREERADYDDEIEALGGRIYRLPRLVLWSPSYHRAVDAFFEAHPEYRIIHVHQDCLSAVMLKAARKHGIAIRIAHSHSSSQDKNLKYLIKLLYKRQIPSNATALFACGAEAGDWMFCGAPYRILNNAIDTSLYAYQEDRRRNVRQALGISPDAFTVGHVGRFDAVKNHTFLLDIFAQVKQRQERAILLLVGEGELRSKMEEKAAALGIQDSVIFTGMRSDVPDLMQAMDCFVLPSLYEGMPVTLIEAQAAGLSCLVSDGVPGECDKTGLVEQIPLAESTARWAERILSKTDAPRPDTTEQITQAGYDITANAQWLQDYYLTSWK